MLVICEDCGKRYRLDPTILGRKPVKFKCKSCTHLIMLPGTQNTGGYTDDAMQRPYAAPAVTTWNDPGSSRPHGSNDGRGTKVESVEDHKMYASAHDVLTAVPGTTNPAVSDAIPAVFSLRSKILFFFCRSALDPFRILFSSVSLSDKSAGRFTHRRKHRDHHPHDRGKNQPLGEFDSTGHGTQEPIAVIGG